MKAIETITGRVSVLMRDDIDTDQVLFATGRTPNTKGMGLEVAGVDRGDNGQIKVDADNRTSVPSIFAVGDVTDRIQLTPIAIREGQAFADTFFGNSPHQVDYACVPSAVFSHPPLAGVGLTVLVGTGLMGLVFLSSRSGHDDEANRGDHDDR